MLHGLSTVVLAAAVTAFATVSLWWTVRFWPIGARVRRCPHVLSVVLTGRGAVRCIRVMIPIELSAIILYDSARRILLQHRTDDAPTFPGYWSFFGGGVEPGETPEQTVVRESLEELDYALKKPWRWMSQPFVHGGRPYTQHIFIEDYDGSPLILGEGQAMGWFAPEETGTLLMSAHSRAAVEALGLWLARQNSAE